MLEVSPLEFRFSLDSEQAISHTLTVKNSGDEPLSLRLYATPPSELTDPSYGHLADWLSLSQTSLTLSPGEQTDIPFSITAPASLPPGGQYASLFIELEGSESTSAQASASSQASADVPESAEQGITLSSRIKIPLSGTISSGETIRQVSLRSFELSPRFSASNLYAKVTLANPGNIDFSAASSLSVFSLSGKELYSASSLTEVLPSTEKSIFSEWGETPPLGFYRLSYSIKATDLNLSFSRVVLVSSPLSTCFLIFAALAAITATFLLRRPQSSSKPRSTKKSS